MAIVESPLLALNAKKTIGKTLTYMRLKGQNVVRQRVIPANPNTASQQTQRGLMTAAVELFHSLGLTAVDLAALNRWATASFRKLSGYNLFVRTRVDFLIGNGDPNNEPPNTVTIGVPTATTCNVEFDAVGSETPKAYIGTSKTSQLTEVVCVTGTVQQWKAAFTSLSPSTTYYFYLISIDLLSKQQRSGLYTFTTGAAA